MKTIFYRLQHWDEDQHQNLMLLNFVLICVHLWLEFLYWRVGSGPLLFLNGISLFLYFNLFFTLREKRYLRYGKFIYWEVLYQAVFATLFMGWDAGFELWLVGAVGCYYFPHFIGEVDAAGRWMKKGTTSVYAGFVSGMLYFLLFFAYKKGWIIGLSQEIPVGIQTYAYYMNIIIVVFIVVLYTTIVLNRLRKKQEELMKYARHDSLTKLYNRHALQGLIDQECKLADCCCRDFVVAIADVDLFKAVNDTYGHEAGDHVLVCIANIILQKLDVDFTYAGRWGGEEFLFLVEGGPEQVHQKLEDFRNTVEHHEIWYKQTKIQITVSIGAARYHAGDHYDQILHRADQNLYYVKEHGRNAICIRN